jgi:hypothetical protein
MMIGTVVCALASCREEPFQPCGPNWSPVEYPELTPERVSIAQGVWGNVWFWQGNFMPLCESGTVTAVGREIHIHQLTTRDQVEVVLHDHGNFYHRVDTPLVATVWSDAQGFFQVPLPVGRYSLFAVEDSLLYANRFDAQGYIWSVDVHPDTVTAVRFDIDYRKSI